jgi:hypothetical protein
MVTDETSAAPSRSSPSQLLFPHAAQAVCVTRRTRPAGTKKWKNMTVYAVTSLAVHEATPAQIAGWIRGHWSIEALHHIRDVTFGEDASQVRTGNGPAPWPRSGTW